MLLRAYRFTDRTGVVLLKSAVALCLTTMAGFGLAARALGGVAALIAAVLLGIARQIQRILLFVLGLLRRIVLALLGIVRLVSRRSQHVSQTAGSAAATAMARRAQRAEARSQMQVAIAEDPLRVQNRLLSGLTILLLATLIGVVLWATNPARTAEPRADTPNIVLPAQNSGGSISGIPAPTAAVTADSGETMLNPIAQAATPFAAPTSIVLPSPVPTATPLPAILEVRGTLAYTAREAGQSDIWLVPVGSRSPLRVTNSPEDDRDPAWSPDGSKLAFASRQDGNWELYIYDLNSGETTRMTYDLSFQGAPQWSPDGEWLVYESYQGTNLDIYATRVDGSQTPVRFTDHAAPDFSPSWSPDGRTIAFVSWRDGNQDIYLFSLDDQSVVNLTNTPRRDEDHPMWNPDGELVAYSAVDEGLEKVFVKTVDTPDAPPQVLDRGRTPAWSPDGASLVFAVDSLEGTQLVASAFAGTGVATEIIPVLRGSSNPSWTAAPLPQALVNSGGLGPAILEPLFIEENPGQGDPPYRLNVLTDVSAPNAVLSERVNDSFNALREAALGHAGWDFLGQLEDAFWQIDHPPQPGEERRNWLMTGRAFAMNRNAIVGFPAPIEVVREDLGVDVYWRVFVRVTDDAQSGQLGEPLRRMPWDFASRNQGDVEAYDQGGRLRAEMPVGYYVDLTQIADDYGWQRVPAGNDWRANFNSTNYWLFQKRDGLSWYDAMRELYSEGQLGGFAPRATPTVAREAATDETQPPADTLLTPVDSPTEPLAAEAAEDDSPTNTTEEAEA